MNDATKGHNLRVNMYQRYCRYIGYIIVNWGPTNNDHWLPVSLGLFLFSFFLFFFLFSFKSNNYYLFLFFKLLLLLMFVFW